MRSLAWKFASAALFGVALSTILETQRDNIGRRSTTVDVEVIIQDAAADGINLTALPFSAAALASIQAISIPENMTLSEPGNSSRVDVHVHAVPDWYRELVPITGQNPTPAWDIQTHLAFMANNSIKHSIVAISSPGSGVYPGDEASAVGLARLLNEWMAALCRTYPDRFSFYAVIPLPYTTAAIAEANYALSKLGAVGVIVLSNHEGKYLGNQQFKPFFAALNSRNDSREIVYIHPNEPVLNTNGTIVSANPTLYSSGFVEFYFETARTIMDLTLTQTIHNFTNIHYDYPYARATYEGSIEAIVTADFVSASEKAGIFYGNARTLFASKIASL
ncbi:Amidohydrolase 2 [Macrophomina phaseolina MS6]|uniref:Amidohydrolase 2 n=1 Tax=Macrophomina phaseolina (strain MS6) TaxID=1126212 RepID=K2QWP0_MACPH|nr:Amidohydrolase 2 [Macrophomina phaseolina MS6]